MRKSSAKVVSSSTIQTFLQNKRLRSFVDKTFDVILLLNKKGNPIYVSPAVRKILGYSAKELVRMKNPLSLINVKDFLLIKKTFSQLLQKPKETAYLQLQLICKDKSPIWIETFATNYLDDKYIQAVLVNFRDITHRKKSEFRQLFLDDLNKKLTSNFDNTITIQEIARLIVPRVADYCRIVTVGENSSVNEISINHKNPKKVRLVRDLYDAYKDTKSLFGIPHILRTGKPEYIAKIDGQVLATVRDNPKIIQIVKALGLQSYIGVPLLVRRKVIGAIAFASIKENRFFTKSDFVFMQEIARQIAYALENVNLHKKAQQAIESRDEFISMASHELKTPITSVKVFTQLLEKRFANKNDEGSLKVLQKMDKNIDKLANLVKDLLDMSRIQQGKLLDLHLEKFFVKDLVLDIIEDLQPISSHTLALDWHTQLYVHADKDRIRQVLINFITNAIKYSPESEKIIIGSQKLGKYIKIFVKDFGIGINKSEQEKIFGRFYQANTNNTYPGLGLGLYISSEIVKRHGGSVGVKSQKRYGSTFYFTLPIFQGKNSK